MATQQTTNRQRNPGSVNGAMISSSSAIVITKYNLSASVAPTAAADTGSGYSQGSLWYDTTNKRIYICEDATTSAAVWKSLGTISVGQISATGTAGTDTFLRGDGSWNSALTGSLSLGTKLVFTSTTTSTTTNNEIAATSTGINYTALTTKAHTFYVAGTSYASLSASAVSIGDLTSNTYSYFYGDSTGSVINAPTGQAIVLSFAGTSAFLLQSGLATVGTTNGIRLSGASGTITSTYRQIAGTSNGVEYNTPTGTYHIFKVNGTSSVSIQSDRVEVGGTYGVSFTNSSGSISSGLAQWTRTSSGMAGNTPTGTTWDMQIAASSVLTLSASLATLYSTNGLVLSSSTGSVTAGNRQIAGTASGLTYNIPTGVIHYFTQNNTDVMQLDASTLRLSSTSGLNIYYAAGSTSHTLTGGSSGLSFNIPTGKAYTFTINSGGTATLDAFTLTLYSANGLYFGASGGTVTANQRMIVPTSTGFNYNVPTSTYHGFYINNVLKGIVDSNWMSNGITVGQNNITCFGYQAGNNLATGSSANTLIGYQAGNAFTSSSYYNVVVGTSAGPVASTNTAGNVLIGYVAGNGISTGNYNTCIGYGPFYATGAGIYGTGSYNIFLGYIAGPNTTSVTSANTNIGIGKLSSNYLTTGSDNIAIGSNSLQLATTCTYQIAIGLNAMGLATNTGTLGVAVGVNALGNLTSSSYAIALGYNAGTGITSGSSDMIAIGRTAMGGVVSTSGYSGGVAIGYGAMLYCNANYLIAIGQSAMGGGGGTSSTSNSGTSCVAVGPLALYMLTTASYVVGLGYAAGYSVGAGSDIIAIGRNAINGTVSGTNTDIIAIGQGALPNLNGCAYNTAIGTLAMASASQITGLYNNAIGYAALNSLTSGSYNLAIGVNSGSQVTSGSYNVMVSGYRGGYGLTTGTFHVAIGYNALGGTASGTNTDCVAIGQRALYNLGSSAAYHIAIGYQAMGNTGTNTGSSCIALGANALAAATSASNCIAIGTYAGQNLTTASGCIMIGVSSMAGVCTATDTLAIGYSAGGSVTSGSYNCFFGAYSGQQTTTSLGNVAMGYYALNSQTTGASTNGYNVAIGYTAGQNITGRSNVYIGPGTTASTTGGYNVCIGPSAGAVTGGSYNIEIGYAVTVGSATGDSQINIGNAYKRDTSGNVTLNHGSSGATLIYTTSSSALTLASGITLNSANNVFKRVVTGATYANSSTTTVIAIGSSAGRIQFFDNTGGGAMVRYDGTNCYLSLNSADWVNSTTPASGEIGVAVSGGNLNLYVGSAATRKIAWFIDHAVM